MANNIYIGNRYVVKYAGQWDDTIEYESLTAVTHQNNAYVSNKRVPAGTLPTDTDFWAFWGSGNAVIDALSQRVQLLEARLDGDEIRLTAAEQDILGLTTRLGLAESNIDSLFAQQASIGLQISSLQNAVDAMQTNLSTLQTDFEAEKLLTEKRVNRNASSGYMGLTSGFADKPTVLASPLIMTANISSSYTISSPSEIVKFNTKLNSTNMAGHIINLESDGTFTISDNPYDGTAIYDVWVSASVLCVPAGNSGIKDIYVSVNDQPRYATEAYFPNQATRVSIQLPEVYIGAIGASSIVGGVTKFGIAVANWTAGDTIGKGSIVGDNYGSTWISIKAYPRTQPVG